MSKILLSTSRFSVEQREFPRANGRALVREMVVHPGAVVILPILDADRIVMIQNFRYIVGHELLELPAGTREPGETPEATASRELEEETGYRAGKLTLLLEFFTSPGILTERMYAYVAEELTYVGAHPEENENITVQITPLDTIRKAIVKGTLKDGKTIAVLGTYLAQLNASKGF